MSINSTMAVALAAAITMGCGSMVDEGTAEPGQENSVLRVSNNNWADATIYVVNGSTRMRLGSVATFESRRFRLPAGVNSRGEVQLLVDLLGSRKSYTTPVIQVTPGDMIQFEVQNHLPLSSYMVVAMRR
jgi:hypothetical protein